jgi:hypothetical protein
MSLIRAVPLKDATRANYCTTQDVSTGYDLTALLTAGRTICAGLHLLSFVSPDSITMSVQCASSSGFTAPTNILTHTVRSSAGSELLTSGGLVGVACTTSQNWWRASWVPSTGSGSPQFKLMEFVGFK